MYTQRPQFLECQTPRDTVSDSASLFGTLWDLETLSPCAREIHTPFSEQNTNHDSCLHDREPAPLQRPPAGRTNTRGKDDRPRNKKKKKETYPGDDKQRKPTPHVYTYIYRCLGTRDDTTDHAAQLCSINMATEQKKTVKITKKSH